MKFIFRSLILLCFMAPHGQAEDTVQSDQVKKEPKKEEKVESGKTKEAASKPPLKPLAEVSLGSAKAPVVMINYSSLTCGHCAHFHDVILPEIKKKYIEPGLVRIIFRDYPADQVSLRAHQLAWCKGELKYLDFVKLLYATQEQWLQADDPTVALKTIALKNGVTAEQFEACIKDQELMDKIIQLRLEGQKKYNITATPTIIISGKTSLPKIYPRALTFEEFEEIIRPLLAPTLKKEKGVKS